MERSITSGFMPWLIVRFPCGSRSISRTRCPNSTNATPRLSVVVVFATPPFWFANAITRVPTAPGTATCGTTVGAGVRIGAAV